MKSRPKFGSSIINFFSESWQELKKVSWPSKQDVKSFTMVVLCAVFFVGLCLFIFDTVLGLFTRSLFESR